MLRLSSSQWRARAIYRMTQHFRNWFKKQALMECLTTNNRLIDLLDKELRNPG
jgi:hypothetical protein